MPVDPFFQTPFSKILAEEVAASGRGVLGPEQLLDNPSKGRIGKITSALRGPASTLGKKTLGALTSPIGVGLIAGGVGASQIEGELQGLVDRLNDSVGIKEFIDEGIAPITLGELMSTAFSEEGPVIPERFRLTDDARREQAGRELPFGAGTLTRRDLKLRNAGFDERRARVGTGMPGDPLQTFTGRSRGGQDPGLSMDQFNAQRLSAIEELTASLAGTGELANLILDLNKERREALSELEKARPTMEDRPGSNRLLALLQGAASGAAGINNSEDVGRLLAAAGAGGLGGLFREDQFARSEDQDFQQRIAEFEVQRAKMLGDMADSAAKNQIALASIESDEAQKKLEISADLLGKVKITLDENTGMLVIFDPVTGNVRSVPYVSFERLKAVNEMQAALKGKSTPIDVANNMAELTKVNPETSAIQAAAFGSTQVENDLYWEMYAIAKSKVDEDIWTQNEILAEKGETQAKDAIADAVMKEFIILYSQPEFQDYMREFNQNFYSNNSGVDRLNTLGAIASDQRTNPQR